MELSEERPGSEQRLAAIAAQEEEENEEEDPVADADGDDESERVVVTSRRQRRRLLAAQGALPPQQQFKLQREQQEADRLTLRFRPMDEVDPTKAPRQRMPAPFGLVSTRRRGYVHDLPLNGTVSVVPLVRRRPDHDEAWVHRFVHGRNTKYITELECDDAKPIAVAVAKRKKTVPGGFAGAPAGEDRDVGRFGGEGRAAVAPKAPSTLNEIAAARGAATERATAHVIAAEAEQAVVDQRAAALAGPRVGSWENADGPRHSGNKIAAAVAKQQFETTGRQHRKDRDKYDAEYDAPKVRVRCCLLRIYMPAIDKCLPD